MRRIRYWRFIIMSIISVFLIFVIPWISIIDGPKVIFSSSNFNTISLLILISGIVYLSAGFLANGLKNKPGKIFGVVNAVIGFWIIILLSINTFIDSIGIHYKLIYFMPIFSLLTVDLVLAIIHISIKPVQVQQKTAQVQQQTAQPEDSDDGAIVNINSTPTQDVSELKNKIMNMKSGLSKSYEEAIDEIERTGALNGLDMSSLLKDEGDINENKIIPYSIEDNQQFEQQSNQQFEQQNNQQFQQQNNQQIEQQNYQQFEEQNNQHQEYYPRRKDSSHLQDPLANSSSDYESIHSSSLSRKDYKFKSRRIDIDDNKH
ncbi:hypothetical protein [Spiroplasma diminutum]|uniref:Transmembrane protein n=1 Tax=Spiroplasma diminutum CUAS-1 TaxID=1276221 RepID=S5LVL5_9MOLU|nr:hypothetical protein [Spiroplasma diminutum]AGR41874.1 hypothetical protein SDIMI_v3c01700 [Spiroplasma diminutum CUAS-1]